MKPQPGIDPEKLIPVLERHRERLRTATLTGDLIEGGRSNPTYTLDDGVSTWVLRRPPIGHVLATAHDMKRERTVMAALAGSDVPVPPITASCDDDEVIGAPFSVMESVPGTAFRSSEELELLGPDHTRDIAVRMVPTLTNLHQVGPPLAHLGLKALSGNIGSTKEGALA